MGDVSNCGPKSSKVNERQTRRRRRETRSGPGKWVPAASVVNPDKKGIILWNC